VVHDPNNNWLSRSELNNNCHLKADHYQKNGINSPPIEGNSPRNSSPVQDNGNLTNNLSKLDGLNDITEKMINFSLQDDDINDESGSSGIGTSGNSSAHSNFSNLYFNKLPDYRRAPGCEMKTLQKQMDYDQKRLMATRAMQSRPSASEPRTPTPSWSGLGFSNSMPENIIREKMMAAEESNRKSVLSGVNEFVEENIESTFKSSGPEEQQHQAWFGGNSSAFDTLVNSTSHRINNGANAILPSDDLPTLLNKQGLAKYTDLFVRHEVDLQTFATLTEQDLREIGIQTFGARKKLLLLANKVKQTETEKW